MEAPAPLLSAAGPVPGLLAARGAVIAMAGVFGFAYSLSAALIALVLAHRGYDASFIGLNAGMHAAGVLLVAPVLPALSGRFGGRAMVMAALAGTAAVLLLLGLVPLIWLWFPLRLALGVCAEVLFVLSETWVNQLSDEGSRGRTMASYTAVMSLGFAGGPLLLSVVGTDGLAPFAVGAGLCALATGCMLAPGLPPLRIEPPASKDPRRFFRLAPVALASTALNAAVETAGLSFLPIYAVAVGWQEDGAARLMGTLMAGAVLCQVPIGWLADKVDRPRLMVALAALAGGGALLWPFVLGSAWLAYGALFLWGGVFVGIYTTSLTIVGSRFKGADLVGIYAASGLVWGAGALAGPMLVGVTTDLTRHALPLFAAGGCLLFAAGVRLSGRSA